MAKKEKSQAELYREERKARLAKSAKKNEKKSIKPSVQVATQKTDKIFTGVIFGIIAFGLLAWFISFSGIAQRTLTAVKVGDTRVSRAEYAYYYQTTYTNYANTVYQYDSMYGEGMGAQFMGGFDYTKAPDKQEYKGTYFTDKESGGDLTVGESSSEEKKYTFADYFRALTVDTVQQSVIYAKLAQEAGLTIEEKDKSKIESQIDELRKNLSENQNFKDFSLTAYLKYQYGNGCTEGYYRKMLEKNTLADKYVEMNLDTLKAAIPENEITDTYNGDKDSYDVVDASFFKIEYSATKSEGENTSLTADEAKAKADAMFLKVSDAQSFANAASDASSTDTDKAKYAEVDATNFSYSKKAQIKSSFGDEVADWAFSADRAAGDKTVIKTDTAYTVVLLLKPRYLDDSGTVDVRHILVKYQDNATDAQKESAYQLAEALLNKWKDEGATEENFAKLAKDETADDGSKENGGLYEDVYKGQMVDSFENWCFDPQRKPGDTGIVKSSYGCHVMYFVASSSESAWKNDIRTAKARTKSSEDMKEKLKSDVYAVKYNDNTLKKIVDKKK